MRVLLRRTGLASLSIALLGTIGLPAIARATPPPETQYVGTNSDLEDDDNVLATPVPIGFSFSFYGMAETDAYISTNGAIMFDAPNPEYDNQSLPSGDFNTAILPFWDDLYTGPAKSIYYHTTGAPGSRKFIVQWTNTAFCCDLESPMGTFQVIMYEGSNKIQFQYRNLVDISRARGDDATIGIQKDGSTANQFSINTESVNQGDAISFVPDGSGGYTDNGHADAYDYVYLYLDGISSKSELLSPVQDANDVSLNPDFEWSTSTLADDYLIAVATDEAFSGVVFTEDNISGTTYADVDHTLSNSTTYYWRIVSKNDIGYTYSDVHSFTTTATPNQAPDGISTVDPSSLTTNQTVDPTQLLSTPFTFDTTDPDTSDKVKYEIAFSETNDPNDAVIRYVSTLEPQGTRYFVYGEDSGTYTVGNRATRLVDGHSYYVNVRTIDEHGAASSWYSQGGAAFTYDATPTEDADGVTASSEDASPNSGDANNDGFPDSWQTNVTSFADPVSSNFAVLQTNGLNPGDCSNQSAAVVSEASQAGQDASYTYPAGLMNFTISCTTPGATVKVTQYFYGSYPGTYFIRKYNSITHTYSNIPGAQLGLTTIAGQPVMEAQYFITDGGPLDEDGTVNGTIVDPSGIALSSTTAGVPNTGLKRQSLTPFMLSVALGLLIVATRRFKRS